MGHKADPVLAVLDYFEHADLALARQAFVLARAILRRRERPAIAKPKAVKKDVPAAS